MLELDLDITAEEALAECQRRGVVVSSERALAGQGGGRHWHLRVPGQPGTLELSRSAGRVWVKVHPLRKGKWTEDLARELARLARQALIERPEITVMFKRGADQQAEITRGWAELEDAIGPLRGRKFYGVFDARAHEYRACVEIREGDDANALGLELGTLAGGRYARVRLRGEPPALYGLIAPAFQQLAERLDSDHARPGIEFYRRHDLIDLYQPVN